LVRQAGSRSEASVRAVVDRLSDEILEFQRTVGELPVAPDVTPDEIRNSLSKYDFREPVDLQQLLEDVASHLRRWSLHVTHPRYFGLFNPSTRLAGVIADALVALYNPQVAAWPHSPIGNEIERHVLGWLMELFGLDPAEGFANFTTGGQEANQTAITVALTAGFPTYGERGVTTIEGQPVIYVSDEAHHSFLKIAHQSGIGREAVRTVPVDSKLRMRLPELARMIGADRAAGAVPFLVVGTAGTTAAGAIDPLAGIAQLARSQRLWFHVDAAWGGAAIVSPALRAHLAGIEHADSITCDAHKWLSAPVGAGMFFTRHRDPVLQSFRVEASAYVPPAIPDTLDPYVTTIQWSRRLIGLKVFMTLAELGHDGLAAQVEHHAEMADLLRTELIARGWEIVNDSPLAIVCFTHPAIERGDATTGAVAGEVVRRGRAWISEVKLSGPRTALRACITSYRTQPDDIRVLVDELERAIGRLP
jgi:aromatic-L-amino-acid decarboxylase